MCGIAGFVGAADPAHAEAVVKPMVAALARRGPDAEGIDSWPHAVLGHRRLSIFDLSAAGRQPMLSPDRQIGIVFNGAIYNFLDLRAELERGGCVFHSHTDTEVLLHGYRAWGIERLVERVRGMFAFGLWDDPRQTLYLVRDRLGIKPLLYYARDGKLSFASTARALRANSGVGELDEQSVAEYLEFGYVPEHRSIYQGVEKVQPGSWVEWSPGQPLRKHQYWSIPATRESGGPSFVDAVEETERLFLRAVETRLQADVPVGALLSGGVDSSLVCWAIAKLGGDITAFTVGAPGDPLDETADAMATARVLRLRHQVIAMQPNDEPDIDTLIAAYGEPFACSSALGMLRVSQAVREHATVLLTGDGGDDLFLGYPEHKHLWLAQRLAHGLPSITAPSWQTVRQLLPDRGQLRRAKHLLDYATGGLGAVQCAPEGWRWYERQHVLGRRLVDHCIPERQIPWSLTAARHVLTDWLVHDYGHQFVSEYLTKVDGGTMHYALEARSPFLDQSLWEFAAPLPYGLRLHGGQLKAILRELARRRIGERVAAGRKRGFGIPIERWLAGRWQPLVRDAFHDSLLARHGLIDPASVLRVLDDAAQSGQAPTQLWYLFVLERWLRYEQAGALRAPERSIPCESCS